MAMNWLEVAGLRLERLGFFLRNARLRWPFEYPWERDDLFEQALKLPDFWQRLEPYCIRMDEDLRLRMENRAEAYYLVTAEKMTEGAGDGHAQG